MGQLEKYGLYVLCLVIFLILGVTIWGGGDLPPQINKPSATAIKAPSATTENQVASRDVSSMPDLTALLRSAERTSQAPPSDPRNAGDPKKSGEAKSADSNKSGGTTGGPSSPAKNSGEPREADARATDPPKSATAPRPTHKVRDKDTFEGIAKDVLGNAALRTEIARLNAGVDPTKLKLGQALLLPTAAEIAQWNAGKKRPAEPASTPPKAKEASATPGDYTVVKGDTFERIAANALGSRKRVHELLELNPTVDPLALKQGQKIKLPKK
ncbi:MAG TPA: LysM domain-containing protein [Planctomycetota bacterium]|nr:LysM domain-containing protein [Planctomycetota bacterium]